MEDKVFENLAGKFIMENTGQGRKIRGVVLASLFHLVFTGNEIESGPLEYYIDRNGDTYSTFYLDDKIFLDEDQLTEEEVEEINRYYRLKGYYRTSRVVKDATTETIKYLKKREFFINCRISSHSLGTKWPEVENGRKLLDLMKNSPEKLITEYFNIR